MADDVRPRTRSSIGAPRGNQPALKKVARSIGLSTNINNTMKPSNKKQNQLPTHQKLQRHQLAHLKVSFVCFLFLFLEYEY